MPYRTTQRSRTAASGRPHNAQSNAGRPAGGIADARTQQRSQSNSSSRGRSSKKAPKITAESGLDRALAAAAAQPAPVVKDFNGYGFPEALVTVLARKGFTAALRHPGAQPARRPGRPRHPRAQPDRLGQDAGLRPPADRRARREATYTSSSSRSRPRPDSRARRAGHQHPRADRSRGRRPLHRGLRWRVDQQPGPALERGVDVVVATPGRLVDLLERRALVLDDVQVTVLDEADYMADLGFLPVVTDLLSQCRPDAHRMLFSATLDRGVDVLVRKFLKDPALHAHAPDFVDASTMEHRAFEVSRDDRVEVAARIASRPARTLFFVRTKHGADRLAKQLSTAGAPALAIHGNLRQSQRQKALDAFQRGESRVLVATDVAARGIHVDDVDLVVHYDLPDDHKDYLHRSGRTARAGADGLVLSLVLPDQVRDARALYAAAGVDVESHRVGTAPRRGHLGRRVRRAVSYPASRPALRCRATSEGTRTVRSPARWSVQGKSPAVADRGGPSRLEPAAHAVAATPARTGSPEPRRTSADPARVVHGAHRHGSSECTNEAAAARDADRATAAPRCSSRV